MRTLQLLPEYLPVPGPITGHRAILEGRKHDQLNTRVSSPEEQRVTMRKDFDFYKHTFLAQRSILRHVQIVRPFADSVSVSLPGLAISVSAPERRLDLIH